MKFKIEETVWPHNGKPRFMVYAMKEGRWDFITSSSSVEESEEYCATYKLAEESKPVILKEFEL